jgi:hypothetical protein
LTLYHVINNTDSVREEDFNGAHIIDANKGQFSVPCPTIPTARLCRPMPDSTNASIMSFVISVGACAFDAQDFLQDMMNISHSPYTTSILDFDVIIIAMGAWEVGREVDCQRDGTIGLADRITSLLQTCREFTQTTGVRIVWRTSGYGQANEDELVKKQEERVALMNNAAMDMIDSLDAGESGLTYINWGGAIRDRSFGPDRIAGDLQYHYGAQPRLVLIQMLTNHLVDEGVL